ncbi:hypothetical protein Rleg5DRAFT_6966, partial [Rhizobium leguminosarum bv. viciae WSM1455]
MNVAASDIDAFKGEFMLADKRYCQT